MKIHFLNRIDPEFECITLLERRFHPNPEASHNVDELRTHLSESYSIPMFELDSLLQPLLEVENYVNSNLNISEDRLRFFFTVRSQGPVSLARHLYTVLKSGLRFKGLCEKDKLTALAAPLSQMTSIHLEELEGFESHDQLFQYLLKCNCTEDVKWICTALYYSMDEYLDELDVILRKATGLFLERLPDVSAICENAISYARERISDNPAQLFGVLKTPTPTEDVTVRPNIMGFHSLHWNFGDATIYVGVYYSTIAELVQKYSDQSASLVSRLKSMSDKSRLEILRALKNGECNGQDISEKLGLAPATISHHMNVLLVEGFVSSSKRGTSIYYELKRDSIQKCLRELEHYLL